jgi:hypothetical protein
LSESGAGIGEAGRHDPLADRNGIGTPFRDFFSPAKCLGTIGKVSGQVVTGAEPGVRGPDLLRRQAGQRGVQRDGTEQAVAAPVVRVGGDYSIGYTGRDTKSACGGKDRMAASSGT